MATQKLHRQQSALGNTLSSQIPRNKLYTPPSPTSISNTPTSPTHAQIPAVTYTQSHENDPAQVVLLHSPGLSNWMGSIHPNGSLYEFPVDLESAKAEHDGYRATLEKNGVRVITVKEILSMDVDGDVVARVQLEDLALSRIKYEVVRDNAETQFNERDKFLLSDTYKRQCVEKMSVGQLVDVILNAPTIYLKKADKDTELLAVSYSFQPLVNLVFTRDQQITTRKGIVMANLSSPIRAPEVEVMRFCLIKLGLPVIGQVPSPGKIEGGDFFAAGKSLCFIGVGLRSNMAGVNYLMENDLLGTTKVAVVKDYFDQNQQRMHLDTFMNIMGQKTMLVLETIIGDSSPIRRLVDEYEKGKDGRYRLARHDVEFSKYVKGEGYSIVHVSEANQIEYGCNGLNLGNGTVLSVHLDTAKQLARSPHFDGKISIVPFRNMMNMYGSLRCCSQVLSRERVDATEEENELRYNFPPSPTHATPVKNSVHHQVHHYQSSNRVVMISPTNFYDNSTTMQDNPLMKDSAAHTEKLSSKVGRRNMRELILKEFSDLHMAIQKEGIEIYLFTHEAYEDTPDAVYVADWFSTHSPAELKDGSDQPLFVLYSMKAPNRRTEKRKDILESILVPEYPRCVNLSKLENGEKTAADHPTPYVKNANNTPGYFLEYGSLVLDRLNKVAYVDLGARCSKEAVELWSSKLGYEVVYIELPEHIHHTDTALALGTKWAVFCEKALLGDQNQAQEIIKRLEQGPHPRVVVSITEEQMYNFCGQIIEIRGKKVVDGKERDTTAIVMSNRAYSALRKDQLDILGSIVDSVIHVPLDNLETLGGGSVKGLIAQLF
eukprot:TRINITY_DN2819_c0_g5_i1.p1 TRINITY_DN2819_c0_g5~~TRINITY_DN2819_c0_g5_i1.p1  ORF type:complete len:829 (-),score=201.18 TRINITY_DN2819_c0_g5_i1:70-2556(-)